MPKYSCVDESRFPGSEPPPFMPCDYYDRDGKLIDRWIVCADTDTGEVVSQDRDLENHWIRIDTDKGEVVHKYEVFPAPLSVRKCECPKSHSDGRHWEVDDGLPCGSLTMPDGTVRQVAVRGPRRWDTQTLKLPGGGEILVLAPKESASARPE